MEVNKRMYKYIRAIIKQYCHSCQSNDSVNEEDQYSRKDDLKLSVPSYLLFNI